MEQYLSLDSENRFEQLRDTLQLSKVSTKIIFFFLISLVHKWKFG